MRVVVVLCSCLGWLSIKKWESTKRLERWLTFYLFVPLIFAGRLCVSCIPRGNSWVIYTFHPIKRINWERTTHTHRYRGGPAHPQHAGRAHKTTHVSSTNPFYCGPSVLPFDTLYNCPGRQYMSGGSATDTATTYPR